MFDDEPWFVGKDVADILGYQMGEIRGVGEWQMQTLKCLIH